MHEITIVGKIASAARSFAEHNNIKKVVSINVVAGELREFDEDFMQRVLNKIGKGSVLEGAKIKITVKPIVTHCKNCGHQEEVPIKIFHDQAVSGGVKCSKCGSKEIDLASGSQYYIETIDAID